MCAHMSVNVLGEGVYICTLQTSRKVNVSRKRSAGIPRPARGRLSSLCGYTAGDPRTRKQARGRWQSIMGVVGLPEGAIVEVELSIDKKPMNM